MRNFILALLIVIIPSALLGGCGTIHFTGLAVIEEPDGIIVTNNTSVYQVVVWKSGGTQTGVVNRPVRSPLLGRGGMWIADTKNLDYNYNRPEEIVIWADVYRDGVYVGDAEYDYNPVTVWPQRVVRGRWAICDYDIRFADPNRRCR